MHSKTVEESLRALDSTATGLSKQQHNMKLKEVGLNEIPDGEEPTWLEMIQEQFEDTLVRILLGAALVSFALAVEEYYEGSDVHLAMAFAEPLVILLILIANAVVGILQESNAQQAINALKEYSPDECHVFVDNKVIVELAKFLVPGDVVELRTGNVVPADCRVISINGNLRIDQSILTGESVTVHKSTDVVASKSVLQDLTNILFSGTLVVSGSCRALVYKTALQTELGKIHSEISNEKSQKSPLKKKLDDFGDSLAKYIAVICILVWLMNINHFNDPKHQYWLKGAIYYFKIAVSLAVAAIPEGLAVVITTCLALGTKRMAKKHAIVRHLPSVETLGCCDVICTDKTGTLTTNQMVVEQLFCPSNKGFTHFSVTGNGYDPKGTISPSQVPESLVHCASLCNDASILYDHHYKCIGEPTEAALLCFVEKTSQSNSTSNGMTNNLAIQSQYTKQITNEFTRDRKRMSVYCSTSSNTILYVKGAPESILDCCTPKNKQQVLEQVQLYTEQGLRVLAFAKGNTKQEKDLEFLGCIAMRDPPRPNVHKSILSCQEAGINVIMITGDHPSTAKTIASQIGILSSNDLCFTGTEWDQLSDQQQISKLGQCKVFSRVEPRHKSQLVSQLQSLNHVVAMTGDGVNDSLALKRANIGIAMGSGTDVAKHASDMILQNDDFNTIVDAIEEGRSIYNNTKQFIRYLISSNIGEVVSIFLTVLLGLPEALIPVQLLWVNLVTDGLPATALGFNPSDNEIMKRPPRHATDPLVNKWLFMRYMVIGMYVGMATVYGYVWYYTSYVDGPIIGFSELVYLINIARFK